MIATDNNTQAKILIVDDEPANLKLLKLMLSKQGYQHIELVDDPRNVIDKFYEFEPDLVLLDINMPHLDGYQVMEQLKALDLPLLAPIIVLTAQHSKDYLLKALSCGARDFIAKPFDRNELLMRVRNVLDAHLGHKLVFNQKAALEELVNIRTNEIRETRLQIIRRLGMAAEYRDEETGSHIIRMSKICALLARKLGWDEEQVELILNASPMHDIGKIGVPDSILLKPGKLDEEEWKIMKTHPEIGAKLLSGDEAPLINMAREIALSHHEKWDGSGYPQGLKGEDIPISGRIAALADVFDALTANRPYKEPWPLEKALDLLKENAGKHFDPDLVKLFMDNLPEILHIKNAYSD